MNYKKVKTEKKLPYLIKELDKITATDFVQSRHYSPVMPRLTKHFLGFFLNEELVGVLTLGYGTQPAGTGKKVFGLDGSLGYLEIGKMCIDDSLKTNAESMMIADTVKWIKKNLPEVNFLYTMADGGMGKCGYCYQASNFFYGGFFETPIFCTPTMEKVHVRSARDMLKSNNDWLPIEDPRKYENANRKHEHLCWPTQDYLDHIGWSWFKVRMYRYALPLNKKARKWLSSSKSWEEGGAGVYPKDIDLTFLIRKKVGINYKGTEKTSFVEVDMPIFNLSLDNIKINKKNVNNHKMLGV